MSRARRRSIPDLLTRRLAAALLLLAAAAGCTPDFDRSPTAAPIVPAEASLPRIDGDWLVARDGTRLPLRVWLPADLDGTPRNVRAVIVALHGFNDYARAFEMPAEIWRHSGIATYAYDQRGFGANPNRGRWPGERTLTQDLADAILAVRAAYPAGTPIYALGESMGGAVVLDAAGGGTGVALPPVDGLVLSAPAVWARDTMGLPERLALWAAVRIIPGVTFTGEGLGVQASDNIAMLYALGCDPLFIKPARVDAIFGLTDLMDAAQDAAARVVTPSLVLFGAHDELIPKDAVERLKDRLRRGNPSDHRFALYPNGWHMLLRDLDSVRVARDVATWIFDHAAPLPGSPVEAEAHAPAGGAFGVEPQPAAR